MHKLLERYFNFIKKFIPAQPESTSIGIDISPNEVKLVEMKKRGESFVLTRAETLPLNKDNPAETLRQIIGDADLSHASVQTAVNGKGTLIRYIDMPRMNLEELKSSFALESDKYFPFAQDQIYTDCFILDPQGKTKQMDVMAAASTKDLVDNRLKLTNEAGIQSDYVGINSVALANILNVFNNGLQEDEQEKKKEAAYAIVDVGEIVSNVTIMVGDLPRFSRDIFIGGRDVAKRIANSLGIDAEEAENIKNNPKDKSKEIASSCESIYQNMTQELRLSFDYFSSEKNKDVSKVLLTGDNAHWPGIQEALKENLEVDVELWNPFEKTELSESLDKDEINKNAQRLSVALGLSLYNHD